MQHSSSKNKTQKTAPRKNRAHFQRYSCEGIPEFMMRLAREQRVKIFEELAMPKYRHD